MNRDAWIADLWSLARGPLRLLGTALALGLAGTLLLPGGPPSLAELLPGSVPIPALIGLLVFLTGLAFAGFLWWLARRTFALLTDPTVPPERMEGLKDLPLALPEGTVRAVLALIVGVIGLPLLLFSASLQLSDAIAGYVNGIIAAVFGFYFGARTGGSDGAMRQAGQAIAGQQRLSEENRALRDRVATAGAEATLPARIAAEAARLDRHLAAAEALVETLGPALPAGLVPEGARDLLRRARQASAAAQALGGAGTEQTAATLRDAADALAGEGPLRPLLAAAAGALPAAAGMGPGAALALVLALGWRLGAAEYRRWRARVLAAPFEPALLDPGLITPSSAELRLAAAPIFARAFAARREEPGFVAGLLDAVLRDDAADRLWTRHGADAAAFPGGRAELEAGLEEFRRALLADQSAGDVTPELAEDAAATLAAAPPGFRPAAAPTPEQANRLIDAPPQGEDRARAAFEALVLLTGTLRERRVDPAALIAELRP